uniref:CXXC-type domain-containing protein n=1 Tax=Globodera pallida TaxID=36090 RepID=A0A183C993_GLOPA
MAGERGAMRKAEKRRNNSAEVEERRTEDGWNSSAEVEERRTEDGWKSSAEVEKRRTEDAEKRRKSSAEVEERRTEDGTRMMAIVVMVSLASWARKAQCLECIQCDRQTLWYSPEENERHIARCQRGLIPPSQCANSSHTHCIFNYFKQGGVITVTERRCGTAGEISGCTLYKSMMRARRHLIAGSAVDVEPAKMWRMGGGGQKPSKPSEAGDEPTGGGGVHGRLPGGRLCEWGEVDMDSRGRDRMDGVDDGHRMDWMVDGETEEGRARME